MFGVVHLTGMLDLLRSNNGVFVFLHEEHIMHDRSSLQAGDIRRREYGVK